MLTRTRAWHTVEWFDEIGATRNPRLAPGAMAGD
jgi:hypothetical protein